MKPQAAFRFINIFGCYVNMIVSIEEFNACQSNCKRSNITVYVKATLAFISCNSSPWPPNECSPGSESQQFLYLSHTVTHWTPAALHTKRIRIKTSNQQSTKIITLCCVLKAHAHRRRHVSAAQIATRPVCKEQYISTDQTVVYLERRVESLAVCMPQLNNTCANLYAKDLTLNAGRQRLRCAWAIIQREACRLLKIVDR